MVVEDEGVFKQLIDERGESLAAVAADPIPSEGVDRDHQHILCADIAQDRSATLPVGFPHFGALAGFEEPLLSHPAGRKEAADQQCWSGEVHKRFFTR